MCGWSFDTPFPPCTLPTRSPSCTECVVVDVLQLGMMSGLRDAKLSCSYTRKTPRLLLNSETTAANEHLGILGATVCQSPSPWGTRGATETVYPFMFFILLFLHPVLLSNTHVTITHCGVCPIIRELKKTIELWMTGLQWREACCCGFGSRLKDERFTGSDILGPPRGGREAPVRGEEASDGRWDSDSYPPPQQPQHTHAQSTLGPHRP